MDAAVLHAAGELPRFETFADPIPAADEALVRVTAAGLHPIVKAIAAGKHYGSTSTFPRVPGIDGVGRLDDGTRVYFGFPRPPHGTMAALVAVPRVMCLPLPEGIDDALVAALVNPGQSAWLSLTRKAHLEEGETVLILGATGAAGQLAVQMAKHLGAARVIAVGRNEQILATLPALGADATIRLDQPDGDLAAAIAAAAGEGGIHVILDYLWGHPTEAAIAAITRKGLTHTAPRVRLVQAGESAGPTITLPAAVLRSSGLEIYGSGAGTVPVLDMLKALHTIFDLVVAGKLRTGVEAVPLADVASAWNREQGGRRTVFIP